jgi:hypothetical protein
MATALQGCGHTLVKLQTSKLCARTHKILTQKSPKILGGLTLTAWTHQAQAQNITCIVKNKNQFLQT